ncbi:Leucine-rich repeat receptor protein kinase EXS precursor [Dorcoceras hygrometricum]|uniref:Leucine-rich repeat receptor protein kinase EXS n=1 Tax=Dorcoceras hygrometricum TaxID=472368 RepID=A0A2Z7DD14_9LAMI|nr:Leucine-rich repeat receptor protein kinase EXS precursor [Dorcoceras hygrometricum]
MRNNRTTARCVTWCSAGLWLMARQSSVGMIIGLMDLEVRSGEVAVAYGSRVGIRAVVLVGYYTAAWSSEVALPVARCVAFSRIVRSRATMVGDLAGIVRTIWTWGWSTQKGSGSGGWIMENDRENQEVVATTRSMAGASTCRDQFSLVSPRFEQRLVTLEPYGLGWSIRKGSGIGGRSRENEQHAEPLGSLGLNGAGDDPVVEFIPTGGDDL